MPACIGHILVRYEELRPTEPAKVPDDLHQTILQANTKIVINSRVVTNPENHSVSLVREYLQVYLGVVTETLLVTD